MVHVESGARFSQNVFKSKRLLEIKTHFSSTTQKNTKLKLILLKYMPRSVVYCIWWKIIVGFVLPYLPFPSFSFQYLLEVWRTWLPHEWLLQTIHTNLLHTKFYSSNLKYRKPEGSGSNTICDNFFYCFSRSGWFLALWLLYHYCKAHPETDTTAQTHI